MRHKALMSISMLVVMMVAIVAAQTYAPIVTMSITLPDGQTRELTAPESGLAALTLKDGTEFGFRPTIQDDRPWSRVTVQGRRHQGYAPGRYENDELRGDSRPDHE